MRVLHARPVVGGMGKEQQTSSISRAMAELGELAALFRAQTVDSTSRPLKFQTLEDRILLNAAPVDAAAVAPEPEMVQTSVVAATTETATADDAHSFSVPVVDRRTDAAAESEQNENFGWDESTSDDVRQEVVFLDRSIDGWQQVLDDLWSSGGDARELDVVLLSSSRDGISQISDALATRDDIDAIHIISHGTSGAIQLGSTTLTNDTFAQYAGEFAAWGAALASDADLLLYGCDLASTADGRAMVEKLGTLCDCDVAASTDVTGHVDLEGDWDLEFVDGQVETSLAVSDELIAAWYGTLDITTNLFAHYEFEENGGGTATDSTVNSNDGSLSNGPTWSSDAAVGDYALDFTGDSFNNNAVVTVPDDGSLDFGTDMTVAFWYNASVAQDDSTRIIGTHDGGDGFSIFANSDGSLQWHLDDGNDEVTVGAIGGFIADGNWHHVAVTRNGSTNAAKIYIDGVVDFDGFVPTINIVNSTAPLTIGGEDSFNSDYEGLLDDVRAYDRELSQSDIDELVALGSSTTTITVNTTTDVLSGDANTSSFAGLIANPGSDGVISLREAITAANNQSGADRIEFGLTTGDANYSGVTESWTFTISTDLPQITDTLTIDGSTQTGFIANTSSSGGLNGKQVIELSAASSGVDIFDFSSSAASSTVHGIVSNGGGSSTLRGSVTITASYFGTDITGTVAKPGGNNVFTIFGSNSTIGGTNASERNLISGHGSAIFVASGNHTVQGNVIGLDVTASTVLGTQTRSVVVRGSNNLIGGTHEFAGNIISGDGDGVSVDGGTGNAILGNRIYGNSPGEGPGLGIDLSPFNALDGVTLNDAGDGDPGSNDYQNFPVLSTASTNAAGTTIAGTLNTTANTTYRIEFFASRPTEGDVSGHGEAEQFLGATAVTTDGSGNGSFNQLLSNVFVNANDLVTATATVDLGGGDYGSTSEFAANITASSSVLLVDTTADVVDGTTTSVGGLTSARGADGRISLREAILAVNNDSAGYAIQLAAGTYLLTSGSGDSLGDLDIRQSVTIAGTGAGSTTIDANAGDRVIDALAGSITLQDLTITDGVGSGAGVNIVSGVTANLERVIVDNNTASSVSGGGIRNDGTLVMNDVVVSNNNANSASGGGLHNSGIATITNSLFVGNSASSGAGGAIFSSGDLSLTNVTVSGNSAASGGPGGIRNTGSATLLNVTVTNNADGGVQSSAGGLTIANSIVTGNSSYDIGGSYTPFGANIVGTDAGLAALAENGGFTQTHALLAGSDAIDAGTASTPPTTDQRGVTRDARADLGAYEYNELVTTITVNTTSDVLSGDADTSSLAALIGNSGSDGVISLREAITAANNQAGIDTIEFEIGDSLVDGLHTITLTTALPPITEGVILDATTDGDFAGKPVITLDGADTVNHGFDLKFEADGSTIRGFLIQNFVANGIQIDGGSDGHTIAGNWIGSLDASGDDRGDAFENAGYGIFVGGANNIIGGSSAADRNVISGNNRGVVLSGATATGNRIFGNYIGSDAGGSAAIGNVGSGISGETGASGNFIGSDLDATNDADEGNVIIASGNNGILFWDTATTGNTVAGNLIGVGADGVTLAGNQTQGIQIGGGANANTIGGAAANAGNVIADSRYAGIQVLNAGSDHNIIQGNFIGTDATGTLDFGNGTLGIYINDDAQDTSIGGIGTSEGNTIAFNNDDGVGIEGTNSTGHSIRGNSIFGNGDLGIDLGDTSPDGESDNDLGDIDSGGNGLQNWAIVKSASIADNGDFAFDLDTRTLVAGNYTIDFYASSTGNLGDNAAGDQAQGERYLFSASNVPAGDEAFDATAPFIAAAAGEFLTITVTDASGNTSEFSNAVVITDSDAGGADPSGLQVTQTTSGGLSINTDGGNDTYLQADDGGEIVGGLTDFTLEARVTLGAAPPSFPHIIDYATAGEDRELSLLLSGDTVRVTIADNSVGFAGSYSELRDGDEHTISVSKSDGGVLRLYIDGEYKEQLTGVNSGHTIASGGNLVIGNDLDHFDGFSDLQYVEGTLHDIRIFDDVRTDAEIAASYESVLPYDEANMVANWRFGQLSSAGVVTEAVAGNNLTIKHTAEAGFTANAPELTLRVYENTATGTIVGSVTGIDAERDALITSLLAADAELRYSAETGKFYKVSTASTTWSTANSDALAATLNTVTGQLATIDSADEDAFLGSLAAAAGKDLWLGGSDATSEGVWRWQEAGVDSDQFWQGDVSGNSVNNAYVDWEPLKPDNSGGDQHYLAIRADGTWNDKANSDSNVGYIVEWDADAVLDATEGLTYSIATQTVDGAFAIDADSGEITVANGSLLDFESVASHSVSVRVTDADANTYDAAFTILLSDVDESPVVTAISNQTVAENGSPGAITFSVSDPETAAGSLVVTAVSDNQTLIPDGNLALGGVGENRKIQATPAADQSGGPVTITVSVFDGTNTTQTTFDVTITAAAAVPTITTPSGPSTNEDTDLVFSVAGGNEITISDVPGQKAITTTLTVTNGTLSLGNTTGISFLNGTADGNATFTISGSQADLNAALDGLTFTPTTDYNGAAALTVTTGSSAATETNLYAHYEFEIGATTDQSGNGRAGVASGNPTLSNDAERGDVLTFDGDDRVTITNGTSGLGDEVTFSAWVNLDAGQQENVFLSIGDEFYVTLDRTDASYSLAVHGSSFTSNSLDSADNIAGEGWNHVAATFDDVDKELHLYLNGELVRSTSFGFSDVDWGTATSPNITIGSLSDGTNAFVGSLDDVRIYDTELTEAEIVNIMGDHGEAAESVAITVLPDGVQHSLPSAQTTDQDTPLTLSAANGNAITVDDGTAATDTRLQVWLGVQGFNGTITLSQTTGLTFPGGSNSSSSMVLWGTEADINAALEGAVFTPNLGYAGSADINVETKLAADLQGHYRFENPSNLGQDTSVGVLQDGTPRGSAGPNNEPQGTFDATRGNVVDLDGTDDDIAISDTFGSPSSITMAAWVNTTNTYSEVFSFDNRLILRVDDPNSSRGVAAIYHDGTGFQALGSGQTIANTGWHHLALTFDGSTNTMSLYIDGSLAAQNSYSAGIDYTGGDLTIGSNAGAGLFLNGLVDDARIYTRALDSDEIHSIANDLASVSGTVSLEVGVVNTAPEITLLDNDFVSVPNDGVAVPLDAAAALQIVDATSTNFDGGSLQVVGVGFDALDLLGIDTSGSLTLSTGLTDGSTVSVGGTAVGTLLSTANDGFTVSFNTSASTANVETLLQLITFESTATTFGDRTINVTLNDGDGTANFGADTATASTIVNVAAANIGSVATSENTTLTLSAADFDFTGIVDSDLLSITVTALPASGDLQLSGSNVTLSQSITKADIDAGNLTFVPAANATGSPYASFEFIVNNGNQAVTVLPGDMNIYTIGAGQLAPTTEILSSTSNFGPSGTYPTRVLYENQSSTIDASYLAQGEIYFDGFVTDANLTAGERAALDTWVTAGGVLISTNDATSNDPVATHYGLTIGGTGSVTWQVADAAHEIMNGPFGLVGNVGDTFSAAGSISYFDSASLATGDVILATDSVSGEPTIILRQHGAGWILFTSDEGIFRANTSGSGTVATANDRLAANVFAWAIDQVPPTTYQMDVTVSAVNNAPTIGGGSLAAINEDDVNPPGDTIANLVGGSFADADAGASLSGIVVTSNNASASEGTWQYSTDGGTDWFNIGTTGTNGLTLSASSHVRFLPATNFNGAATVISFRALDDTYGSGFTVGASKVFTNTSSPGGSSPISSSLASIAQTVTAVNDAAIVAANNQLTVSEGSTGNVIDTTVLNEGDPDDSGAGLTYRVNNAVANGTLRRLGVALVSGITFTQEDIDLNRITYDHDGSNTTTDGFTFSLNDGGEDGTTPVTGTFNIAIAANNDAPVITSGPGGGTSFEGTSGTYFNNGLTVADSDSVDFDDGTITVTITTAGEADDRLIVRDGNNVSVADSNVEYDFGGGPVTIGSFTGGLGLTPLAIAFNSNATLASVEAVAQQVAFQTISDTPSSAQRGLSMVVTDGDGGTSNIADRVMNVVAVNDTPTFNNLSGSAASYAEGGPAVVLDADIQILDLELNAADNFGNATLTLVRSSGANADDVYSATGTITAFTEGNDIVMSGVTIGALDTNSGGTLLVSFYSSATGDLVNEFAQQLAYANASVAPPGSVQINRTFNDGNTGAQGSGGVGLVVGSTTVTIASTNSAPAITPITNQSINEDSTTGPLAFSVSDAETAVGSLIVTATSSDQTILPDGNLTLVDRGGGNWTIEATPAADQFGTATVALTVDDGSNVTARTFDVAISPINEFPELLNLDETPTFVEGGSPVILDADLAAFDPDLDVIGHYDGADLLLHRNPAGNSDDIFSSTGNVDVLAEGGPLVLSGETIGTVNENSNGRLRITFNANASQADVSETLRSIAYANTSVAPPASVTLRWQFGDGNSGAQGPSGPSNYITIQTVLIDDSNSVPTVTPISNHVIAEDTSTSPLTFSVFDTETAADSLIVTASSNDQTLIPDGNLTLVDLGGGNWTIEATPVANATGGPTTVTVVVDDGTATSTTSFDIAVTAVNDAPTVTGIANQTIDEDTSTGPLTFFVDDIETSSAGLLVSASSSDQTLIPDGNLTLVDLGGGNWTIEATPAANATGGPLTITVTVDDGTVATNDTFTVRVTATNDVPTISAVANQTIPEDGSTGPLAFSVADVETGASSLTVTATSDDQLLLPDGNLTLVDLGTGNWTVEATPVVDQNGGPVAVTLSVDDGVSVQESNFFVTVTNTNDAPTGALLSNTNVDENSTNGTSVGRVSAVDIDSGDSHQFALVDDANSRFTIDQNSGVLTVADSGQLNFEQAASHQITVRVTDAAGLSHDETFTIRVADLNETPVGQDSQFATTQVGEIRLDAPGLLSSAIDEDGDPLSVRLVSNVSAGQLVFNADGSFTYTPNPLFEGTDSFSYRLSDGVNESAPITVSIEVDAIAPAPPTNIDGDPPEGPTDDTLNEADSSSEDDSETESDEDDSDDKAANIHSPTTSKSTTVQSTVNASAVQVVTEITNIESESAAPNEPIAEYELSSSIRFGNQDRGSDNGNDRQDRLGRDLPLRGFRRTFIENPISEIPLSIDVNHVDSGVPDAPEKNLVSRELVVGTTKVVSTSLTVGYVVWMVRGGTLAASLVASLPAWTSFDPLAIVSGVDLDVGLDDGESLSDLVNGDEANGGETNGDEPAPDSPA